MTNEELEKKAEQYATEDLPDGYTRVNLQKKEAYIAGAKETGVIWHDLRRNPNDLPKRWGEYLTNIGVLVFDTSISVKWCTLLCEACDYYEEVSNEVVAWCELPKFETKEVSNDR